MLQIICTTPLWKDRHKHAQASFKQSLCRTIRMSQTMHAAGARMAWLLPVLSPVLQGALQHLHAAWNALSAAGAVQHRESAAAANDEVVQEHLLRELTTEHMLLLVLLHDQVPGAAR